MSASRGKRPGDFVAQRSSVVVEPQPHAGEGDLRADLRGDREIVPAEAQLPQQPGERAGLRALGREVGERVQADVVVAAAQAIERVQPADRVVPLENADALVVIRQPNPGGQPGHPRADDDGVVHGSREQEFEELGVQVRISEPCTLAPCIPLLTLSRARCRCISGSRYATVLFMLARLM